MSTYSYEPLLKLTNTMDLTHEYRLILISSSLIHQVSKFEDIILAKAHFSRGAPSETDSFLMQLRGHASVSVRNCDKETSFQLPKPEFRRRNISVQL